MTCIIIIDKNSSEFLLCITLLKYCLQHLCMGLHLVCLRDIFSKAKKKIKKNVPVWKQNECMRLNPRYIYIMGSFY